MGNNASRFDGQTAWRLAPATGRASETIVLWLYFCVSFPKLRNFAQVSGQEDTAQESQPDSQAGVEPFTAFACPLKNWPAPWL
jgi:hypothetical protein